MELTRNRLHRNTLFGVVAGDANGLLVRGNRITENCGGQAGFVLGGDADNVLIESNNVSNNTGSGIEVGLDAGFTGSNLTITNTTANDNGRTGVGVIAGSSLTMTNITANDNGATGIIVGQGLAPRASPAVSQSSHDRILRDVKANNNSEGVYLSNTTGDDITAIGNDKAGILLADSAVLENSEVSQTRQAGSGDSVGVAITTDTTVRDTIVTNNDDVDIKVDGAEATLDSIDIGSATFSATAKDVNIYELEGSPPPEPTNLSGINSYFGVNEVGGGGAIVATSGSFFDVSLDYTQSDALGIAESTLELYRYNLSGTNWEELGGFVNASGNTISANITEVPSSATLFGAFGKEAQNACGVSSPLISRFSMPPTNTGELDPALCEDLDGDGSGKDVDQTVAVFGHLIRDNDLGLTDDQAKKFNWNSGSPETEVTPADMVSLFGKQIRAG